MAKSIIPLTLLCVRRGKRITQQELADIIGVTQTEISMIESGSRKPNDATLEKLGKYFKCPGEVLFKDLQECILSGDIDKYKLKISK